MKKIVLIGGGTGIYTLLSGLKKYPCQLTSIVSMMDSGGSTGRLIDEFGILPVGDIRRSILALSENRDIFTKWTICSTIEEITGSLPVDLTEQLQILLDMEIHLFVSLS